MYRCIRPWIVCMDHVSLYRQCIFVSDHVLLYQFWIVYGPFIAVNTNGLYEIFCIFSKTFFRLTYVLLNQTQGNKSETLFSDKFLSIVKFMFFLIQNIITYTPYHYNTSNVKILTDYMTICKRLDCKQPYNLAHITYSR
jgi:hypothetical protein